MVRDRSLHREARRWTASLLVLAASSAFAVAVPSPCRAAGLSLGWLDCRTAEGLGTGTQSFNCQFVGSEFTLFPAVVLGAPVDSVIAVEMVIDVDVASDLLPAWWQMSPGGCREDGWSAGAVSGNCADPWGGAGVASVQGWLPGTPFGSARHGRLLIVAGVVPSAAATLAADVAYSPCRVVLRSVGTLACEGCTTPACLVLNSMLIRRLPGSMVEEVFVFDAETPGQNHVLWQQGPGPDCQSVPTRRATWGAIKALYR